MLPPDGLMPLSPPADAAICYAVTHAATAEFRRFGHFAALF